MRKYIIDLIISHLAENGPTRDEDLYVFLHDEIQRRKSNGHRIAIYFVDDPITTYWSKPISDTLSSLIGLGLVSKQDNDPPFLEITEKAKNIFM